MKKIWKYLFLFISCSSSAQITLDHIVDSLDAAYGFTPVQISSNETKYFFRDTVTNTFSLYNMNFTPFLTNIIVPEPWLQGTDRFQALYITRTLFDCDSSNIEYAYTEVSNHNRPFRIMRTDGTSLFQLDSANGPYCIGNCYGLSDFMRPIRNTSEGAKLFLQKYTLGYPQVFVYSLCGILPNDVFDLATLDKTYVEVFPNPSSLTLTFKINLPDNMNEYELLIFNSNSQEVKRERINTTNDQFSVDVRSFSNGTYIYSLCTKNKTYHTGKFIITK